MVDFTGGVSEKYKHNESPPNLFEILLKAHERSSLLSCGFKVKYSVQFIYASLI
jgi:calpain